MKWLFCKNTHTVTMDIFANNIENKSIEKLSACFTVLWIAKNAIDFISNQVMLRKVSEANYVLWYWVSLNGRIIRWTVHNGQELSQLGVVIFRAIRFHVRWRKMKLFDVANRCHGEMNQLMKVRKLCSVKVRGLGRKCRYWSTIGLCC